VQIALRESFADCPRIFDLSLRAQRQSPEFLNKIQNENLVYTSRGRADVTCLPRWRFGLVKRTKSTACKGEKVADRPDEGADLELV